MTKKDLLNKCTDYQNQLDAATKQEDYLRGIIRNYVDLLDNANQRIIDLETQLDAATEALSDRLEFEEKQLEIFTRIIREYQGE